MIKLLKFPVLFLISVVLQTTLVSWISVFDIGPDFILIFVVLVALRRGPVVGMLWGFFAGFSQDIYAPVEWLGAHAVALTVVGFIVGQFEERFLSLNLVTKIGVLGLGFLICDIIYFVAIGVEMDGEFASLLLMNTLPECIYTMLCGTLVFHFVFHRNGQRPHAR